MLFPLLQRFRCLMKFCSVCALLILLPNDISAHESCCQAKLRALQGDSAPQFIVDTTALPPVKHNGELRYIDDPTDFRPDYWDDEDDGLWEPRTMDNPQYDWQPPTILNPDYVPPLTVIEKVLKECKASIPWVTIGILVAGCLSVVALPVDQLQRWLLVGSTTNNNNNQTAATTRLMGLVLAAFLGLATPLCSCGALPLAVGLLHQGVPLANVMSFLTASQSAGLDSALITLGLLGQWAVWARLMGAALLAVGASWVCTTQKDSKTPTNTQEKQCNVGCDETNPGDAYSKVVTAILDTAVDILPTVLAGLVLSTIALHYIPSLLSLEQDGNIPYAWVARWVLLGSVIPLQLCEHTSVTLAAAIPKAGGSNGLAFAFLLSAPATNLPTLLLLLRKGGSVATILFVLLLSSLSVAISYLVDAGNLNLMEGSESADMPVLPEWFSTLAPYMAGMLFVAGFARRKSTAMAPNDTCCSTTEKKSKTE